MAKVTIDISKCLNRYLTVTRTDDGLIFEGSNEQKTDAEPERYVVDGVDWAQERREGRYEDFQSPEPDWQSALVVRNRDGQYAIQVDTGDWMYAGALWTVPVEDLASLAPITVIIDADGRNVEAEQQREAHHYSIRLHRGDREDLEAKLAEAVRGRETALRDLRKAEQRASAEWERAEAAEAELSYAKARHRQTIREYQASLSVEATQAAQYLVQLNQARDSYAEQHTDLERANLAWKSARHQAKARAACELENFAAWVFLMGADYKETAREARVRAAKLRGEK